MHMNGDGRAVYRLLDPPVSGTGHVFGPVVSQIKVVLFESHRQMIGW